MSHTPAHRAGSVALCAVVAVGVALSTVTAASGAPGTSAEPSAVTGPSSSESPYLVGVAPGVQTTSVLTVGDSPTSDPEYRMAGIPDGLGAFDNGDGTFTVLMNHELRPDRGTVRAHGSTGAFVSRWVIDKTTLEVLSGDDLVEDVFTWNGSGYQLSTVAFNRLCSAHLADPVALYDPASGLGYDEGRVFTNGEEAGAEGRAFAHVASGPDAGTSVELPHLGNMSFENVVSRPVASPTTVTVALDDSTPGQVYVHVGQKRAEGNPAERAGLVGGSLFGIKVEGLPLAPSNEKQAEDAGQPLDGAAYSFTGVDLGDVSGLTGAELEARSTELGVTQFARPEDGSWTVDGSGFVFATTASFTAHSRLWRLEFVDPADPSKGGTIRVLLEGPAEGTEGGPKMMDNLTVDAADQVLVQEDPGGQEYLAGVFRYDPMTDTAQRLAHHDPSRFSTGGSRFLTIDEESSGIVPLEDILGDGYYLLDSQVHLAHPDPELVEHGQLLIMRTPVDPGVVTMVPERILAAPAVTPGTVECWNVAGTAGIPADATGVILNVTTVSPTGTGYAVVYPDTLGDGATPVPATSTVNFEIGKDVANTSFVRLPENGDLCYATRGAPSVGLLVDVSGYVTHDAGVVLTEPGRLLDTRPHGVGQVSGPVAPRTVETIDVAGRLGVPADAESVLLNVTVSGVAGVGNLRVFPGGSEVPNASVINYAPGQDKANATVVTLSEEGTISFYSDSDAPVQVIIDVLGYTEVGSSYAGITPTRVLDTRAATRVGDVAGPLTARTVYSLPMRTAPVPAGATAVVLNVTAVGPTSVGNLRVYPDADGTGSTPAPDASTVNYIPGRDIPNLVVVDLPENGQVNLWSDQPVGGSVHVAVDVVGYVVPVG